MTTPVQGAKNRVSWNNSGERLFHTGVDRGMLYVGNAAGVPWNGLISVTENPSGGDATPTYLDGQKVLNVPGGENFAATIEAYGVPIEFAPCVGWGSLASGLFATEQPKETFGFSYRTLIGNDVEGTAFGYKLHIVFNALAKNADFSHKTITDSPSVQPYSFDVTTVPLPVSGQRATAHFIFDTRVVTENNIAKIESILYGSDTTDPTLPDATTIFNLKDVFATLQIIDNGDGTWTAVDNLGSILTMTDGETFSIDWDSAVVIDTDEYSISSL
jgi:hypothetical protein